MLHDTNYTFYNVINKSKVSLAVAIIEYLDGFAFNQFVGESEVCHIGATGRTINCEETETGRWDVVELTVGMCHQLVALFGCGIKRNGIINLVVC